VTEDPEFAKILASVDAVLDADPEGKKISATIRAETLKRALSKYGGKTYASTGASDDIPWQDEEAYPDQRVEPTELSIPEPTEAYWYQDPEQGRIVRHFILMRRALGAAFHGGLLIVGGSGYGKTMGLPHLIDGMNADLGLGLRTLKMDCGVLTDPQRWFGRREIDKAGSRYEKSDFILAVENGDIILLDEINRIHPTITDSIHSLLDGSQTLSLSDLNLTITVNPLTCFVATMNLGSAYGGTHRLDHAFRTRFGTTIEVGPPPREEEIKIISLNTGCDADAAAVLVDVADKTRSMFGTGDLRTEISTRELVAAGRWVAAGMTEKEALSITALPLFDGDANGATFGQESDRAKVAGILAGKAVR
jgi:MoxR-like ATPase